MFPSDADPLDRLREATDLSASLDLSSWSPEARSQLLVGILGSIERLRAEAVRIAGQWDAGSDWAVDGALSAPSWLAHRAPLSKRDARQLVRTARVAFRHERTGKALAAGDVTSAHADVLATLVKGREKLFARDEDVLLDIAPTLSVDDFAEALKHWRSAADDELSSNDAHHNFENRSVTLASTLFGRVELHASLDAEAGAIVARALDAYDRPDPIDGPTPPRTVAQRRADALTQICSEALGEKQAAGHHVPNVDLVLGADRSSGGVSGHGFGRARPAGGWFDLFARCEIEGIGPVARVVAERITCDSAVCRVVMHGVSEVLDLGRRQRVPSRALRRALERRDGRCVFPGCDAPISWCDVHHLVHWADGGPTDLENCVLLCRRHHVLCHEGGWRLAREPGGGIVVAVRGTMVRTRRKRPPPRPPGSPGRARQSRVDRSDL